LLITLVGCATYHGVGPLKSAGENHNSSPGAGAAEDLQLSWPVRNVAINRGFKEEGQRRHEGLDLHGGRNTPIYAAHSGQVVYAGHKYRGFGNMIIVEFSQKWATLYAHLQAFKVKRGERVSTGQLIGLMGRTGHATGVHLHFELIKDKHPVDPLLYLPTVAKTP
jgi:murein DD-endopeptidase MepM/ murein hydrolase activator NlpD